MKKLGQLLSRYGAGSENRETLEAATVTAAASSIIQHLLGLSPNEAQAIIFQRQSIIVKVSHGGIAGRIKIHEQGLLKEIQKKLHQTYGQRAPIITRLLTRQA